MLIAENQLKEIKGGGAGIFTGTVGLILLGVGSFLIGLIDGFLRPLSCRS